MLSFRSLLHSNERQKWSGSRWEGKWGTREITALEVLGVEGLEIIIWIYCMRNDSIFFNKMGNNKKISKEVKKN